MLKTFKQVFFILKVFFIICSEILLYCIFLDYSYFIDKITYRLSNSNILYVKVFQAIALNNNLIDDKTNNKLLRFTDNAPWSYSDINYEELIEVSNKYEIVFPYGYELPINSGMISLVFKGYKKSGKTPMIIKMKINGKKKMKRKKCNTIISQNKL